MSYRLILVTSLGTISPFAVVCVGSGQGMDFGRLVREISGDVLVVVAFAARVQGLAGMHPCAGHGFLQPWS